MESQPKNRSAVLKALGAALLAVGVGAYILHAKNYLGAAAAPAAEDQALVNVVVLDSAKLAFERLEMVKKDGGDADQAARAAREFAIDLSAIMGQYEEAGILVLNKSVALAVPGAVDITPLVAKRLGIHGSGRDDDDSADGKPSAQ